MRLFLYTHLINLLFLSPMALGLDLQCKDFWKNLISKGEHHYFYQNQEFLKSKIVDEENGDDGNSGYESWLKRTRRSSCAKSWTVLVYMAADNDLFKYAIADLREMEWGFKSGIYGGSTLKSDLIVEIDSPFEKGARRYHIFQTPYIENDPNVPFPLGSQSELKKIKSPVVSMVDNEDLAQDKRFLNFLKWGVENYPANHYMVVVWGHGQGWTSIELQKEDDIQNYQSSMGLPDFSDLLSQFDKIDQSKKSELEVARGFESKNGGLAFDDSSGGFLTIPQIHRVLKNVSEYLLNGKPFDLYVSDACLMQQLEVAYELSDSVNYIVGSAQLQNYLGLPYRRIMYELNRSSFLGYKKELDAKNETDEPYLLSLAIPKINLQSASSGGIQWKWDLAISQKLSMASVSSHEFRFMLYPQINKMAEILKSIIIKNPILKKPLIQIHQLVPEFAIGMKDFGIWIEMMERFFRELKIQSKNPDIILINKALLELKILRQDLNRTVLSKVIGVNEGIDEARAPSSFGVSIWLPDSKNQFDDRKHDFSRSKFYSNNNEDQEIQGSWSFYLKELFSELQ